MTYEEIILILSLFVNTVLMLYLIKLSRSLSRKSRYIERKVNNIPRYIWSALAVNSRLIDQAPLPIWNDWSAPPDFLSLLIETMIVNKPKKVVEFGSGLSSVVIASLLREFGGGKLISIEHDEEYAAIQRKNIITRGLEKYVEIRVAPIAEKIHLPFNTKWYEEFVIEDLYDIDLVIIDGPPMAFGREVRYPGGSLMISRLSDKGILMLDDADRPGEKRIRETLLNKYPELSETYHRTMRGCSILKIDK